MKTETGCSVLQSFESLSATLAPAEYGIHTGPFHERNYPGDPLILSYYGAKRDLDRVGAAALKEECYLNMLAAGLQRKANIESWRSTNVWCVDGGGQLIPNPPLVAGVQPGYGKSHTARSFVLVNAGPC